MKLIKYILSYLSRKSSKYLLSTQLTVTDRGLIDCYCTRQMKQFENYRDTTWLVIGIEGDSSGKAITYTCLRDKCYDHYKPPEEK